MENDKRISVYIVEDYLLTRVTYKQAMKDYPEINIIGDFETAEECENNISQFAINNCLSFVPWRSRIIVLRRLYRPRRPNP